MSLVVNLFAGPGTGKSSTMAGVFSELKWRGVNCEQAPEFAKEKVWEEATAILSNQIYVFGKQLHTIYRVLDKVDVIVTDSPILLSIIYDKSKSETFHNLVVETFKEFDSLNIFLRRHKKYNPSGRLQTEEEAKALDFHIQQLMRLNDIPFVELDSGRESVHKIVDMVIERIGEDKQEFK